MLIRALIQYLLYRAMQCIGSGVHCNTGISPPTCAGLTGEMMTDLEGPKVEPSVFLECVKKWAITVPDQHFFSLDDATNLRFVIPQQMYALNVTLSDYDVGLFGWIVLHIFMAQANLHLALKNDGNATGVLNDDLLRLLAPFKVKQSTEPGKLPPSDTSFGALLWDTSDISDIQAHATEVKAWADDIFRLATPPEKQLTDTLKEKIRAGKYSSNLAGKSINSLDGLIKSNAEEYDVYYAYMTAKSAFELMDIVNPTDGRLNIERAICDAYTTYAGHLGYLEYLKLPNQRKEFMINLLNNPATAPVFPRVTAALTFALKNRRLNGKIETVATYPKWLGDEHSTFINSTHDSANLPTPECTLPTGNSLEDLSKWIDATCVYKGDTTDEDALIYFTRSIVCKSYMHMEIGVDDRGTDIGYKFAYMAFDHFFNAACLLKTSVENDRALIVEGAIFDAYKAYVNGGVVAYLKLSKECKQIIREKAGVLYDEAVAAVKAATKSNVDEQPATTVEGAFKEAMIARIKKLQNKP